MITKLEQEFFYVFGIEPKPIKSYGYWLIKGSIAENDKGEKVVYPEITERRLLEMICICNSTYINGYTNYFMATGKTKEELKEEILKKCITLSKDINNKIQQLFKVKK